MAAEIRKSPRWGVLAEYENPAAVFHACEKVRDAGFTNWDAHTPFPVHGLDRAMGVKDTRLPWLVAAVGFSGTGGALALQWWVHSVGYPLVISGKPFFAWPTYVPIMFEVSVLFAAFAAVAGMLAFNGLPRWNHPVFESERFARASDDRFFISIEASDPRYDAERTAALLRESGATHVEFLDGRS